MLRKLFRSLLADLRDAACAVETTSDSAVPRVHGPDYPGSVSLGVRPGR